MTKNEMINNVIFELGESMTQEQIDRLKIVFCVKMKDFEITPVKFLPSVDVTNNDWAIQRFMMDMYASGKAKRTIEQYANCAKRFFNETSKDFRDVKAQDIMDYMAIKQYRGDVGQNGKVTIKNYLSAFFKWAYKRKLIPEDIMLQMDVISPVQKKKDRITDTEVEKMRNACKTAREKAFFELLISCGLRVGEIKYVTRDSIDLQSRKIEIYGEKTKTTRVCNLTLRAALALEEYMNQNPDKYILFSNRLNEALTNKTLEKIAKGIGERAGVHLSTTVHVYRKTFASVLYRKTKDLMLVQKSLGHSSASITIKYYLVDDIDDMAYRFQVAMN